MADLANVTMTGRLTRDPETREAGKTVVTKFSIAVNGFKKEDVSFFNCEAWGKVGEIISQYTSKGKQIAIAGTIRIDSYEDNEGNARKATVINVRDMTLLGSKDDAQAENNAPAATTTTPIKGEFDDIPF